jgi:CRP/FNR family cyclic AMP-dependent transcriptional regulator
MWSGRQNAVVEPSVPSTFPADTFLGGLSIASRSALLGVGQLRRFGPRTEILREGTPGRDVLLVLRGHVKVGASTPGGHEMVLAIRGRGDVVGELAAIDRRPRSATVTTLALVTARQLTAAQFSGWLAGDAAAAALLARVVAGKLRAATQQRLEVGAYGVNVRLARTLLYLEASYSVTTTAGRAVTLGLTQGELAGLVGVSLESVVKALAPLRRAGVVRTGRRELVVCDAVALRRIAAMED